jgi:hypothetical protein
MISRPWGGRRKIGFSDFDHLLAEVCPMVVHGMNTPWSQSSRLTTNLIIRLRQTPSRSKDLEFLRLDVVDATAGQVSAFEGGGMPRQVLAREAPDQVLLDDICADQACGLMSWGSG